MELHPGMALYLSPDLISYLSTLNHGMLYCWYIFQYEWYPANSYK